MKRAVREYVTSEGANPFRDWLGTLDLTVRARIQARLSRFELGNLGDRKAVGGGVWEARVHTGPGYRIYFGDDRGTVIALLGGGDKKTQQADIRRARAHWADYLARGLHGTTKQGLE